MGESKNKNDNFLEDHLKYNSTKFGANPPNILGGDSFLRKSPKIGTDNAHLGLTPKNNIQYLAHRQIFIHQKFQPNPPKGLGENWFLKAHRRTDRQTDRQTARRRFDPLYTSITLALS